MRRDVAGALELAGSTSTRLDAIVKALDATPAAPRQLHTDARALQRRLNAILVELRGERRLGSRSGPVPVAISERANTISSELNRTLARQTTTHEQQLQIAGELFAVERAKLKTLVDTDVPAIERELERLGAPYTPGRVPRVGAMTRRLCDGYSPSRSPSARWGPRRLALHRRVDRLARPVHLPRFGSTTIFGDSEPDRVRRCRSLRHADCDSPQAARSRIIGDGSS